MDFTYFVAFFLSLAVGFVCAIIYVALGSHRWDRLLVCSAAISVVLDFALLIDWAQFNSQYLALLLFDLLIFAFYAVVGVVFGVSPVLAARSLFRWFKAEGIF